MANSSRRRKNSKPHKDFPLTHHKHSGRWCKKVRGKFFYFGKVADDPQGEKAIAVWIFQKDDILAGRKPRDPETGLAPGVVTTDEVVNRFLSHKNALVKSGELAPRTYDRYHGACSRILAAFGRTRAAADLRPEDFEALRVTLASSYGPAALANEIQMTRSVFRYGYEAGLLDKPLRFGPGFKKPSAKTLRQTRQAAGPRLFTPEQIKSLLDEATPNMAAMILLGINGGLGNTDLALLPLAALDLEGGWLNYPRAKTAIDRRIPLWKETLEAIHKAIAARGEPNDPQDAGLVFIGRRGESYTGNHKGYRVDQEFTRIAKRAKVVGRTFYDLRRTFETIGGGSRDQIAVDAIMGHAPPAGDMASIYRQRIEDDRLRAVVNHVRAWLYPPVDAAATEQASV